MPLGVGAEMGILRRWERRFRYGGRLLLAASLVALLGMASPPGAGAQDGAGEALTDEEVEELLTFVIGNTMFTFYHELGHALVDMLEIPVLGREEDAADSLAIWLMVPEEPDPLAEAMLLAAAEAYILAALQGEEDDLAYWGEHSLDLQRFAAIHCLLYGSNPEGFAELAQAVEMPQDDRDRCPATYAQVEASWQAVLSPHLREAGQIGGGRVLVRFDNPGPDLDPLLRELVEDSGLIQAAAEAVTEELVLPRDIPVLFADCGEANAFYDPRNGEVTMCYELLDWLVGVYLEDLERHR